MDIEYLKFERGIKNLEAHQQQTPAKQDPYTVL